MLKEHATLTSECTRNLEMLDSYHLLLKINSLRSLFHFLYLRTTNWVSLLSPPGALPSLSSCSVECLYTWSISTWARPRPWSSQRSSRTEQPLIRLGCPETCRHTTSDLPRTSSRGRGWRGREGCTGLWHGMLCAGIELVTIEEANSSPALSHLLVFKRLCLSSVACWQCFGCSFLF